MTGMMQDLRDLEKEGHFTFDIIALIRIFVASSYTLLACLYKFIVTENFHFKPTDTVKTINNNTESFLPEAAKQTEFPPKTRRTNVVDTLRMKNIVPAVKVKFGYLKH